MFGAPVNRKSPTGCAIQCSVIEVHPRIWYCFRESGRLPDLISFSFRAFCFATRCPGAPGQRQRKEKLVKSALHPDAGWQFVAGG